MSTDKKMTLLVAGLLALLIGLIVGYQKTKEERTGTAEIVSKHHQPHKVYTDVIIGTNGTPMVHTHSTPERWLISTKLQGEIITLTVTEGDWAMAKVGDIYTMVWYESFLGQTNHHLTTKK